MPPGAGASPAAAPRSLAPLARGQPSAPCLAPPLPPPSPRARGGGAVPRGHRPAHGPRDHPQAPRAVRAGAAGAGGLGRTACSCAAVPRRYQEPLAPRCALTLPAPASSTRPRGKYPTPERAAADVALVWSNCFEFNDETADFYRWVEGAGVGSRAAAPVGGERAVREARDRHASEGQVGATQRAHPQPAARRVPPAMTTLGKRSRPRRCSTRSGPRRACRPHRRRPRARPAAAAAAAPAAAARAPARAPAARRARAPSRARWSRPRARTPRRGRAAAARAALRPVGRAAARRRRC
jgi:hypothetical protein